ncbi:MAG: hypothetical protein ABFD79_00105 [Phycisphaerales bacterium]
MNEIQLIAESHSLIKQQTVNSFHIQSIIGYKAKGGVVMPVFIHGILIASSPSLSWEEINEIAGELVHIWKWFIPYIPENAGAELIPFATGLEYVFTCTIHFLSHVLTKLAKE